MENFIYQIMQINRNFTRELGFQSLEELQERDCTLFVSKYDTMYQDEIEVENKFNALDLLFHKFNVDHPRTYTGRSMSVGDIVKLNNEFWYCDRFGWKQLECIQNKDGAYFQKKEN